MSFTCLSCSLTASSQYKVKLHENVAFASFAAELGTAPGTQVAPRRPSAGTAGTAAPGLRPPCGQRPRPPASWEGRWRRPARGQRARGPPAGASAPPPAAPALRQRPGKARIPDFRAAPPPHRLFRALCGKLSYSSQVAWSDLPGACPPIGIPGVRGV